MILCILHFSNAKSLAQVRRNPAPLATSSPRQIPYQGAGRRNQANDLRKGQPPVGRRVVINPCPTFTARLLGSRG